MAKASSRSTFVVRAAIAAVVLGGFTGAAFAAWMDNGSAILVALAASGLAWCF